MPATRGRRVAREEPNPDGNLEKLRRKFSKYSKRLLDGASTSIEATPDGDEFIAHGVPHAYISIAERRRQVERLLEIVCQATRFDNCSPLSLVEQIVGDDANTSMARVFLAALTIASTHDLDPDFWHPFLRKVSAGTISDKDFVGDKTVAVFGRTLGRRLDRYGHLLWPLRLVEGTMVSANAGLTPFRKKEPLEDSGRHFRVTLPDGAIVSANRRTRDSRDLFLKIVNCPGPPNEWQVTEELRGQSTQSAYINVPIAGVENRDDRSYQLVSDWSGINLAQVLLSHEPSEPCFAPQVFLRAFFLHLVSAVKHCHCNLANTVLVHGDLHEGNILFDQPEGQRSRNYRFLITDFENAWLLDKRADEVKSHHGGRVHNFGRSTAPETRELEKLTTASDIWSLARIFVIVYIWAARGREGLAESHVLEIDFWQSDGGEKIVQRAVKAHMQLAEGQMATNRFERRTFSLLHDLIMNDMLCTDPAARKDISHIYDWLAHAFSTDSSTRPPSGEDAVHQMDGSGSRRLSGISADTGNEWVLDSLIAIRMRLFDVIMLSGCLLLVLHPSLTNRVLVMLLLIVVMYLRFVRRS